MDKPKEAQKGSSPTIWATFCHPSLGGKNVISLKLGNGAVFLLQWNSLSNVSPAM